MLHTTIRINSTQKASPEHARLKFTDDIFKCFDDTKVELVTFNDLSKAFDCVIVDHETL